MNLELNKAEQIQKILENNTRSLDFAKIGLEKYQADKIQETINSLAWLIEFFRESIMQEREKTLKSLGVHLPDKTEKFGTEFTELCDEYEVEVADFNEFYNKVVLIVKNL